MFSVYLLPLCYNNVVLFYVFLVCSGGGGGGCVELSFRFFLFLLHGLYGALCSCVPSGLVRLRFEQCSFVVAFVDGFFICGCSFSNTLRMSNRRLSVIIFCLCDCYFLLFVAWCACGGKGVTIILLPPPPSALHQPYRSRLYKGC